MLLALSVCLVLGLAPSAWAQAVFFPYTNVGQSAPPKLVFVNFTSSGTLASILVRTQGRDNFDYSNAGGGSCTANTAYSAGGYCTVNVGYTPTAPADRRGAIVLLDASNNVLGTQALDAYAVGALLTFVPGTITTLAGNGTAGFSGDTNLATTATLASPGAMAEDGYGNIYIADTANNRIRKVTIATGVISTIAGTGTRGATGDGGPATAATLNAPTGITIDNLGNILFSDRGNHVIRRISTFDQTIATIAGTSGAAGYSGDGGQATAATLKSPTGIIFDSNSNFYIADTGNSVIRRIAAGSNVISTVAGNGTAGYSGDGAAATAASLNAASAVALFVNGDMYIADTLNHVVRRVDAGTGVITTVAGTHAQGFSGDGGAAISATLNSPAGIAIDGIGNLFIADTGNNRIRKAAGPFSTASILNTIAGDGTTSTTGDQGPANLAGVAGPQGIVFDNQGTLFIAETQNHRIRKVPANSGTLAYPATHVGSVSATETIQIQSLGTADLQLAAIQPTQQSAVDAAATTCSTSTPLPAYSLCTVGAQFAPTMPGNPDVGTITILSNASNSPATLSLSGDAENFNASTVTIASTVNPSSAGQSVSFLVTVGSAGTPTGTVNLLDGTTQIASATLTKSGFLLFTIPNFSVGTHPITAVYTGDSNNGPATSPIVQQVVNPNKTALLLGSSLNPSYSGQNVVFTATVASLGAISGTVLLFDGTTQIASAPVQSNGSAVFNISTLSIGSHTIKATYMGDSSNASSTSAPLVQVVNLSSTVIVLASSVNPSGPGQTVTFSVAVSGPGKTATGTVTLLDGATQIGSAALQGTGNASFAISNLALGSHSITASYAGDPNNGPATSQPLLQVVSAGSGADTFSLTATPATVRLASGQRTTLTIVLAPGSTFADTVSLGCAGLPLHSSCTFSSSQVALGNGTSQTVTAVLDTADPPGFSSLASVTPAAGRSALLACALPAGLLASLLALRRRRLKLHLLAAILALAGLTALSGCGSGINFHYTAAGTYAFQVVGSGNASGVRQASPVQLTVTP